MIYVLGERGATPRRDGGEPLITLGGFHKKKNPGKVTIPSAILRGGFYAVSTFTLFIFRYISLVRMDKGIGFVSDYRGKYMEQPTGSIVIDQAQIAEKVIGTLKEADEVLRNSSARRKSDDYDQLQFMTMQLRRWSDKQANKECDAEELRDVIVLAESVVKSTATVKADLAR